MLHRLLILEDNPLDAALLRRHIDFAGFPAKMEVVDSEAAFREALRQSWDAIVSDYDLPGFGALPALRLLKKMQIDTPLLIVSGRVGEESAVDALLAGADDFVMKNNLSRLVPSLGRSIRAYGHRRAEAALRAAHERALRDRERLLAIVCHDLRNPLASITLRAERLQEMSLEPSPSTGEVGEVGKQIARAADRITRLVHDILDQARIEEGALVLEQASVLVSDFFSSVREVFAPLASQRGIALEFVAKPGLRAIFDRERMFQVLSNLLGNALKFTPPGKTIYVRGHLTRNTVEFEVEDGGPGVPETQRSLIFDKFRQGDQHGPGVGLGLYIAREVISAHGGTIVVDAGRQGGGALFRVSIPQLNSAALGPDFPGGFDVLLVDDDEELREAMVVALQSAGHRAIGASSLTEARNYFTSEAALDIALVDCDLAGEDGCDFVRWIQASHSERAPRFVLMSAHPDISDRAIALQVEHVLRKPMSLAGLRDVVEKAGRGLQRPPSREDLAKTSGTRA